MSGARARTRRTVTENSDIKLANEAATSPLRSFDRAHLPTLLARADQVTNEGLIWQALGCASI
jgi:hypothetical protein